MIHVIILKKDKVIFTTEDFKKDNEMIVKIVMGLNNITDKFYNEDIIKLEINHHKIFYKAALTNVQIIVVTNKKDGDKEIMDKVYKVYSKCVLLEDFELFEPLLKQI